MGIFFAILAALLASTSNFCMRRSIDAGGSSKAYLMVQLTFSFLVMILMNPVRTGDYGFNPTAVTLGVVGGVLFGLLMWGLGKTLEKGPPGLSLAILNTSSVMPAILLAFLFGPAFNQGYTLSNGIGSVLVAVGLLWAGWTSEKSPNKAIWALFAALIFFIHTLYLIFLQWWAMVLNSNTPTSSLLPFHLDGSHTQWFMPAIFFVGALFQWIMFFAQSHKKPNKSEVFYGILGGFANGGCSFFLILAPQMAKSWENPMIFPIFSVSIILICNAWAQTLYKEKVNWKANILSIAGLAIGTIAWNTLL